jgi:hypothetical protein
VEQKDSVIARDFERMRKQKRSRSIPEQICIDIQSVSAFGELERMRVYWSEKMMVRCDACLTNEKAAASH